jgi:hypothetical protein
VSVQVAPPGKVPPLVSEVKVSVPVGVVPPLTTVSNTNAVQVVVVPSGTSPEQGPLKFMTVGSTVVACAVETDTATGIANPVATAKAAISVSFKRMALPIRLLPVLITDLWAGLMRVSVSRAG